MKQRRTCLSQVHASRMTRRRFKRIEICISAYHVSSRRYKVFQNRRKVMRSYERARVAYCKIGSQLLHNKNELKNEGESRE